MVKNSNSEKFPSDVRFPVVWHPVYSLLMFGISCIYKEYLSLVLSLVQLVSSEWHLRVIFNEHQPKPGQIEKVLPHWDYLIHYLAIKPLILMTTKDNFPTQTNGQKWPIKLIFILYEKYLYNNLKSENLNNWRIGFWEIRSLLRWTFDYPMVPKICQKVQ